MDVSDADEQADQDELISLAVTTLSSLSQADQTPVVLDLKQTNTEVNRKYYDNELSSHTV